MGVLAPWLLELYTRRIVQLYCCFVYWEILVCHKVLTSCLCDEPSYPRAMSASLEDDHIKRRPCLTLYHKGELVSLSVQCHAVDAVSVRNDQSNSGYHWRHSDRFPRLTLDHRQRCHMLTHMHLSGTIWTGLIWYLLMQKSNCRARKFHHVVEMLVDCCIRETGPPVWYRQH